MKSKKELRNEILKLRSQLTEYEVRSRSGMICEAVISTEAYRRAENICLYMPVRNEVDIVHLADAARADGKTLWIPRVEGRDMSFYRWDEGMKLTKSVFGIPEPEGNAAERLSPHSSVLVIMPGAVFSVKKDRIGYGGGYYDRFLAGRDRCETIAVCYDFQIKDDIPADKHDIRPDAVISESRIIR